MTHFNEPTLEKAIMELFQNEGYNYASGDELRNSDRILAIGSSKTISYSFKTICELIQDYFKIIEESNSAILLVINKHNITTNQYFPIYGFGNLCSEIEKLECLKNIQSENLKNYISNNIKEVYNNESINSIIEGNISSR